MRAALLLPHEPLPRPRPVDPRTTRWVIGGVGALVVATLLAALLSVLLVGLEDRAAPGRRGSSDELQGPLVAVVSLAVVLAAPLSLAHLPWWLTT